MNNNIRKAAYGAIAAFVLLVFYLTYLQVYRGEFLYTHPNNKRLLRLEQVVSRGSITDSGGVVLAQSRPTEDGFERIYPQGEGLAHLVGYSSSKYGKTGLESSFDRHLLPLAREESVSTYIKNFILGIEAGNNLVLTIDVELQEYAYRLLGGRKGSLVALSPTTGEVLALVSSPSFDPNKLEAQWAKLVGDTQTTPLLNRATQGLYPPGSAMKVVTGAGALEKDPGTADRTFFSPGYLEVDGYRLEDTTKGTYSFPQALKYSSNAVFGSLGLEIGPDFFHSTAQRFKFEEAIAFDLPLQKSQLSRPVSKAELAEAAIGQGKVLVSPLHMALIASALANDGMMMRPYLVKEIRDPGGELIKAASPAALARVTSSETALVLKKAMEQVVDGGTGRKAALSGVRVAGKTGSAENPHGPVHSWFIGFAPADNPKVAVAVILENAGAGGAVAAPMAGAFIGKALKEVK